MSKKLKWGKLLCAKRLKGINQPKQDNGKADNSKLTDNRTEIERDYDRILFAAPTRRLADKTQVFPLEKNVSIRTRLTHSYEVSNLARSIGTNLVWHSEIFKQLNDDDKRNIPSMLAAIGLAHDIGNPPFGHQGEEAIRSWFRKNTKHLDAVDESLRDDFLKFEGNAQAIRLLTKLQLVDHGYGLDLTVGTLAAMLKYPISSAEIKNGDKSPYKKFNYFNSEKDFIETVWEHTGLSTNVRHPLTYIMEACDDIAYSVLDAEDSVKKGLVSFLDLIGFLENEIEKFKNEQTSKNNTSIIDNTNSVIEKAKNKHLENREQIISPNELNEISMQKFRVYAIYMMINQVIETFEYNYNKIMHGQFKGNLIENSDASLLCKALKDFGFKHGYKHREVLEIELRGHKIINELMDMLWTGITKRDKHEDVSSKRSDPFANYAYHRISENYRRVFESEYNGKDDKDIAYGEAQLLTDMISGMADNYALELHEDLKKYC